MRARHLLLFLPTAALLGGCAGAPLAGEQAARGQLARVGETLRPRAATPVLPQLRADSPPGEFVRYAVLNHPAVIAAYDDWRASIEAITPARSLPDPQFTFQADITDSLMTFMPGLMFDFMVPGKRAAMGREATAAGNVAYRDYVATVLRIATDARKAWVELTYVAEVDRLYGVTISAAEEALALANADYTTGRGMGNFEKQIRLQNLAAQHHAHHAAIVDRLVAARARFKAALGIGFAEADPSWPRPVFAVTALPSEDELWQRIRAANPALAKMRAMVDMAVASVDVARQGGTPDFSLGAMADLKASPLMVRPVASVTLPVWRDKISAAITAAEAHRDAALARVSAEELNLAAELAQMLYMVRESDRMLAYIDDTALPNLGHTFASLEAGVQSGMTSPSMISETRLMEIDLRHERLELLRNRENAAVDLVLLFAAVAPDGAPLLPGPVPASPEPAPASP